MPDFGEVFTDARKAAAGELKKKGKVAADFLKKVTAAQRKSLESLLRALAAGEIDKATFDQELEDEKRVMRTELLALKAIGKQAAQDATNAFFSTIKAALPAGIGGLL